MKYYMNNLQMSAQAPVIFYKSPENYLTHFLTLSVVTLSLSVFRFFDYSFTFAFMFVIAYCAVSVRHMKFEYLLVYLAFIVFFLLNALVYFDVLDGVEYLKSFLLVSVSLFCYVTSLSPHYLSSKVEYHSLLRNSTILIVGFQLLQVFEQFILGGYSLWFVLDSVSISTAVDVGRFEAPNFLGYFRPISFYHEPSYLAMVSFVLLAVNDRTCLSKSIRLMLIMSILLSLSATVIVFLLMYILIGLCANNKKILLIVLLGLLLLAFVYSSESILSFFRISEIGREGTSGYFRLVLPFIETLNVVKSYYFGIPLGQLGIIFDNSFYLIVAYFGVLSPFVFVLWFIVIKYKLKYYHATFRYFSVCFALLFVSGAIFTLEAALLLLILNAAYFGRNMRYD